MPPQFRRVLRRRRAAPAPEVVPAVPAAAPPPAPKKKGGSGPALGLDPNAPQVGGLVTTTSEAPAAVEEPVTGEWKFDVTGYFRAPLRFSWGPPTTHGSRTRARPGSAGTQLRTPPLVPDANYIDWRYTNSMVGPWTELNFHYGNDRVKATVQIASYNVTDSGLPAAGVEPRHQRGVPVDDLAGVHQRERAADVDRGRATRTATARRVATTPAGTRRTCSGARTRPGQTLTFDYDWNDWTFEVEEGFGGKLEPIPFYGPPEGTSRRASANQNLPAWEPYPGPVPQESTFVAHAHVGAVFKKEVIIGAHYIDVFANDNERAGSYQGSNGAWDAVGATAGQPARQSAGPEAEHQDLRRRREAPAAGCWATGTSGTRTCRRRTRSTSRTRSRCCTRSAAGSCTTTTSGRPAAMDPVTGTIDSVELQYSFSFGQLFHYPQAFWGDGPDLIGTIFGMYNKVKAPENPDVLALQAEVRDGVDVRAAAVAGARGALRRGGAEPGPVRASRSR